MTNNDFSYSTMVEIGGRRVTVTAPTPLALDNAVTEAQRYWSNAASTAAQAVQEQLGGTEVHTCANGQMVHKSGESKTSGKPWSGWFCPLPRDRKDEQCAPTWDRS